MTAKILILNGHPDPVRKGLCHALADAYGAGAAEGGHEVRRLDIATLAFGFVHSQGEFEHGDVLPDIAAAQESIKWASHVVVIFPLWLGDVPAVLKAFLEHTLRPGFAYNYRPSGFPEMLLTGRSARIVVTMGMPAFVYRWYFRAHGAEEPQAQHPALRRLRAGARHPARQRRHAQQAPDRTLVRRHEGARPPGGLS